jgi:Ribbon-helix-helix protein, copG family
MADPIVMERLKALAKERGVSLATVVREALEEKAKDYRPKPKSIGMFASTGEPTDIASTMATERVPVEDR